jgi:hypothetical protein
MHRVCTRWGLVILRDHTNNACGVAATVYRRKKGLRYFGRKLDSEDGGSGSGEACWKAHWGPTCVWRRLEAIHGVTRLGAWPLRGLPCEGLQRGLGRSLCASRYLSKNTRVVNGSLHLYLILASIFTLQSWLCGLPFLA